MDKSTSFRIVQPAPIALFVYARADHTAKTLRALADNALADQSDLFIFSDAPRSERERRAVEEVRRLIRQEMLFKSVTIIERTENYGLAQNIIEGVSFLTERYGRAIVIEDDLVTSPCFLDFMNRALDRYAGDPAVWHINGWTYPIAPSTEDMPFFTTIMECWGWATWRDRWEKYSNDPERYVGRWTKPQIERFNVGGGYDYWLDIVRNMHGTMKTWAVFWYATIFENGGLCLSPAQSYVINIGIDGSGANSGSLNIYDRVQLNDRLPAEWPESAVADEQAWDRTRKFLLGQRAPLWRRAAARMKWSLRRASALLANGRAKRRPVAIPKP